MVSGIAIILADGDAEGALEGVPLRFRTLGEFPADGLTGLERLARHPEVVGDVLHRQLLREIGGKDAPEEQPSRRVVVDVQGSAGSVDGLDAQREDVPHHVLERSCPGKLVRGRLNGSDESILVVPCYGRVYWV